MIDRSYYNHDFVEEYILHRVLSAENDSCLQQQERNTSVILKNDCTIETICVLQLQEPCKCCVHGFKSCYKGVFSVDRLGMLNIHWYTALLVQLIILFLILRQLGSIVQASQLTFCPLLVVHIPSVNLANTSLDSKKLDLQSNSLLWLLKY